MCGNSNKIEHSAFHTEILLHMYTHSRTGTCAYICDKIYISATNKIIALLYINVFANVMAHKKVLTNFIM